jgi:hypothetical protein
MSGNPNSLFDEPQEWNVDILVGRMVKDWALNIRLMTATLASIALLTTVGPQKVKPKTAGVSSSPLQGHKLDGLLEGHVALV